jgi:hypothetical protein
MSKLSRRLPDFIIAGAPRSGTTWLYMLAQRHPRLAMAEPMVPEPKFFLVDEIWRRGTEYYSSNWFEQLPAGRILGEKSANYLESPVVVERIHCALPQVKLIFLLRNPVDRAYSNYLWSRQNGVEVETFERALALEEQRERELSTRLRYARPHAYFSRGLYAQHLARFFDYFPREQVLVLRHEDIMVRPDYIAAVFQSFLGVTEVPGLARGLGRINATKIPSAEPFPEAVKRRLAERYRAANANLATLLACNFDAWNSG